MPFTKAALGCQLATLIPGVAHPGQYVELTAGPEASDDISRRRTMTGELSKGRLYAMRSLYLFTAVVVGFSVWPVVINQGRMINGGKPWDLIHGIAFSLYAAYASLMLLGVRFPMRMLPLMLLQPFYKLIWLIAVGYPLWAAGRLDPGTIGVIKFFAIVVVLDLVVIPWPYVFEKYAKAIFKLEGKRGTSAKEQASAAGSIG